MNLTDFITSTLTSIAQGMDGASKTTHHQFRITTDRRSASSFIEFDVAVTSETEKKGSGGIKVWVLGAKAERGKKHQNVSRLKFKVLYRGTAKKQK
ncbi:MAG: trypco2 family protein [Patescibacteria group bacterium]